MTSWHELFALIAPVHAILYRVSWSYEMIPNVPKHYTTHQNMSLGSNGVESVRSREKSRRDFVARTFALIALVHPILHLVSCGYEMIPNAPKHYATHQNMSLGYNGVDWVVHCEKSGRGFMARTFAIIAPVHTILHRVSCSYETITNAPKHNETYENISLGSNGVDWMGSLRKMPT